MAEKEGLQKVLRDVERAGQSFQQHYWVKTEELKKTLKEKGWKGVVDELGGVKGKTKAEVKRIPSALFDTWKQIHSGATPTSEEVKDKIKTALKSAGHSSDDLSTPGFNAYVKATAPTTDNSDPNAPWKTAHSSLLSWTGSSTSAAGLRMMGAAAKLMGGKPEDWPAGKSSVLGPKIKEGHGDAEFHKTVLGLHVATKLALEEQGYKPRTMYRGMGGEVSKNIVEAAKGLADKGIPFHEAMVSVNLNPVNSFSETEGKAQAFAHGPSGIVLRVHDVPADAYLAHYKVQGSGTVGFTGEKEGMIMFKGPLTMRLSDLGGHGGEYAIKDYFKSKGLYDQSKVDAADMAAKTNSKAGKPPKTYSGHLPSVTDLPDLPAHALAEKVQQKKGKGAVPEWQGTKTWRDLWTKWAKKEGATQAHVNAANVVLKKYIHAEKPNKAQFKAFFQKVIKENMK